MGWCKDKLTDVIWELEKVREIKNKFKARAKELKKENQLLKQKIK